MAHVDFLLVISIVTIAVNCFLFVKRVFVFASCDRQTNKQTLSRKAQRPYFAGAGLNQCCANYFLKVIELTIQLLLGTVI